MAVHKELSNLILCILMINKHLGIFFLQIAMQLGLDNGVQEHTQSTESGAKRNFCNLENIMSKDDR